MPVSKLFCGVHGGAPRSGKASEGEERPQSADARAKKRLSERVKSAAVEMIRKSSVAAGAQSGGFSAALEKVTPAVVVLETNYSRAFEGETAGSSTATGFVVDKKRGIILTNRHVVTNGPVRAHAKFINKEEIPVEAIYADPVHDFAFFRFDPAALKFIDVVEIALAPSRARVGLEIRVVGNDAGEQLQILGGTLARLDRDAPAYSGGVYSDYNTFYYSAASSTSGGSSGSPVVDAEGYAVALNAGARTGTASSFYLPLHRVVRALDFIRKDQPVPRRTVQAVFTHESFSEVERLGLPEEVQAKVRAQSPEATGMLVASVMVPSGPAAKAGLQVGDILVKLNGTLLHEFAPLEMAMDDSLSLTMEVQRGAISHTITVKTDDLHELAPREFMEISEAIVHPLSYHQALASQLPIGAVVVATPGYMLRRAGLGRDSVILAVGDEETPDLESFSRAITKYPDLAKVSLRTTHLSDRFREAVISLEVDRTWFVWRHARRTFSNGVIAWQYTDLPKPSLELPKPHRRIRIRSNEAAVLFMVRFNSPFYLDGLSGSSWVGAGVLVDAQEGLVVTDRNTVPNALGNCSVTIGDTYSVPAQVVFVHPTQNFSLLKFDAALLEFDVDDAVTRLEAEQSPVKLRPGMTTVFAGYTRQLNIIKQRCEVNLVDRLVPFPPDPPRFTARNQTVIHLDKVVGNLGGVLQDDEGLIQAFWFSFSLRSSTGENVEAAVGIPAEIIFDTVNKLRGNFVGKENVVATLGVDLSVVHIAQASAAMGLSEAWVEDLAAANPENTHVISVRTVMADSPSSDKIKAGDLLLAVDGEPLTDLPQLDLSLGEKDAVELTLLRSLKEITISVPVTRIPACATTRVVIFAGMTLQAPHPEVAFTGHLPEECKGSGVYCTFWYFGSPSDMYQMEATSFIIGINEKDTPTLDDFLDAVSDISDDEFMRVRLVSLNGQPNVVTLKADRYFWPTVDLRRDAETMNWNLEIVDGPSATR